MKTKRLKNLLMGMGLSRNQVNYMVKDQRTTGSPRVSNAIYYYYAKRYISELTPDWLPLIKSFVLGNAEEDANDINKMSPPVLVTRTSPKGDGIHKPHPLDDITSERILQMKGILAEPGKAPVIASLPDSLWAIENRLGTPCEMIVLPRTPAVLFVGRYDGPIQPASLLNRKYRGRQLYGPILCYGWKGNNIQPMNKDVQTEMLDRLKGTEVRI